MKFIWEYIYKLNKLDNTTMWHGIFLNDSGRNCIKSMLKSKLLSKTCKLIKNEKGKLSCKLSGALQLGEGMKSIQHT